MPKAQDRLARVVAMMVLLTIAAPAFATPVRDLVRLGGRAASDLQGWGVVTGLNGTGDAEEDLARARPLLQVLRNNGFEGLTEADMRGQNTAIVFVTAKVSENGAQTGDLIDASVSIIGSATSLRGGRLFLSPMSGPFPGMPVYAMASGRVLTEEDAPATGVVRNGAQIIRPILPPRLEDTFTLVLRQPFRGFESARYIAERIRSDYALRPAGAVNFARAIDDATIEITVPEEAKNRRQEFYADVMNTVVQPSRLRLPARVVIDRDAGSIVLTGDVRIGGVVVSHGDLTIRRLEPEPLPTPQNPIVTTERAVVVGRTERPTEAARLADLLETLNRLDVPVADQIGIVEQINRAGQLFAEIVEL